MRTRSGWLGGREVVELVFDSDRVSFKELVQTALKFPCGRLLFARNDEQRKIAGEILGEKNVWLSQEAVKLVDDQKYWLVKHGVYQYVPMTERQATLTTSEIGKYMYENKNADPDRYLSPWQMEKLHELEKAVEMDPKVVEKLKPDRSPEGLPQYTRQFMEVLSKAKK